MPLGEQRGEGERLGVRPHQPLAVDHGLAALLELLDELGVHGEAVGHGEQLLVEDLEPVLGDRGLDLRRRRAVELVLARLVLDALGGGDALLELCVGVREHRPDLVGHLGGVLLGDDALVHHLAREQLAHRRVLLDHLVHLGLGVGGLVGLVVAEAAVADQVDHHVVAELLAEGEGQPHRAHAGGHVVGVDVDDGNVEALGQIRRVGGGTRVVGVGGEAHLVVLDEVDRPADGVAVQRLEVERLGHHALAGEGGVAVEDHRDGGVGVLVGVRALARGLGRARGAGRHRSHELQVRRVGLQAHDDRLAARQRVGALGAVVVLDVAGAALGQGGDRLERRGALELGEDRVIGPAQVVGQDVEAAAVGHADHDLAGAAGRRQLDELVEHRHRHVQALDARTASGPGRPCA